MNFNSLSQLNPQQLRQEGFAALRHSHAFSQSLASALEDLDSALILSRDERSIDELEGLRSSAQRLSALLEKGVPVE
ncbi:hypothetical protein [Schlesneria sp. DSM 10557]|uniref:hypothetical protein n=1 Tax=Schlesneria sp. DSM 10557 TaxID=3044399 RepID=UPI00359FF163